MMISSTRHPLLAFALVAALGACGKGSTNPVAKGNNGNGNGNGNGAGQSVAVAVSPQEAQVAPGGAVPFAATVTGTANTSVVWSIVEAGGGSVSSSGVYTAPATGGTFHVVATSAADATKFASSVVTVSAPQTVAITVSPSTGAVNACRTLQLSANVTGSADTAATWSVQEGAAGGTISAAGLYTAPSGPGVYHVVATSHADPTKTALVTITVNELIISVTVSPATVTLNPGGTQQFTASVTNSCGTFTATSTLLANGTIIPN